MKQPKSVKKSIAECIPLPQGCKNAVVHLCHATKMLECVNVFFYILYFMRMNAVWQR